MENKNKFEYTYVAPTESERRQIQALREKYLPEREKSSLDKLKSLDAKVNRLPTALALCMGVIGTLIFGLGFTMILEWNILAWGVLVSFLGFVPLILAYPVYRASYNRRKAKYGEEILKLSEKLLSEREEK